MRRLPLAPAHGQHHDKAVERLDQQGAPEDAVQKQRGAAYHEGKRRRLLSTQVEQVDVDGVGQGTVTRQEEKRQ